MRRPVRTLLALVGPALAGLMAALPALAADKVRFGTNWLAEAEHGGFYQALADGTYARAGLDVTIVQGGPQSNNRMLLPVGRLDFYMGVNMIQAFQAAEQGVPTVAVAAMFQKEPQVLIAHPGQGFERFEALKDATLFISRDAVSTYFAWLKQEHGFKEERTKPYTFNPAPFLADKRSAQQGYVTAEPFAIEKQGGFKPVLHLLADHGFDAYSTTVETRVETARTNPDLVKRFVEASVIGWYTYLYGDPAAGNALIKRENPEMTDDQIAFSIAKMKEYGIVDSGDSLTKGIGAMDEARVGAFYDKMVKAGVVKAGVDWRKAVRFDFVNKGLGLELRPKG